MIFEYAKSTLNLKGQLIPQNEPFSGQITSNVKVKNPHFRAERASVFLKFPLENLTYIAFTAAILYFYCVDKRHFESRVTQLYA